MLVKIKETGKFYCFYSSTDSGLDCSRSVISHYEQGKGTLSDYLPYDENEDCFVCTWDNFILYSEVLGGIERVNVKIRRLRAFLEEQTCDFLSQVIDCYHIRTHKKRAPKYLISNIIEHCKDFDSNEEVVDRIQDIINFSKRPEREL